MGAEGEPQQGGDAEILLLSHAVPGSAAAPGHDPAWKPPLASSLPPKTTPEIQGFHPHLGLGPAFEGWGDPRAARVLSNLPMEVMDGSRGWKIRCQLSQEQEKPLWSGAGPGGWAQRNF